MSKRLSETYREYFPIGAAVTPVSIDTHKELLVGHFSSLTAENQMKPGILHPSEHIYNFEQGDVIADFALQNHMLLRGHTLVWHNQTPEWFFKDGGKAASRTLALKRMKEHIYTVMGHYKGRTCAWDVVNEAIADQAEGPALRQAPWLTAVGGDYIEHAFRYAREADSTAKLFYNDYNECDPVKSKKIYELVKSLLERGVPVDGIGMQGHWNIYVPELDKIRRAIELYASLGISLQITELDISLFRFDDGTAYEKAPAELIELQAERYGRIFELLREYKALFTGITFWGIADDDTWLSYFPFRDRKNWPLLFDDQHRQKKSFENITNF
ncbi:endo-1,4-beta-xylanase B [Ruminiclostridium hungatei]|uniref:Beta-xylanase n=1 Tax=Ruminiclostridium hungatei TaxID=48256 RepID=A0A1V4SKS5_RUMHU|nr:endo-1,4-beta-xylanase [Ruminiclostridium hungatei]OPX44075.1 endo-1,4-beta-xylanase B [Ruminiclostridium hungatei]